MAEVALGKLAQPLIVIGGGLLAGYVVRRRYLAGEPGGEPALRAWSRLLKLIGIGVLVPPIVLISMLTKRLAGHDVWAMAMLGAAALLTGATVGRVLIALRNPPSKQAGAFLGCAAMSNILSFGGLVCFVFWGNVALQFTYLFKLFEHLLYFGVFYPWCSTYSPDLPRDRTGLVASFRRYPVTLVPIAAVAIGVSLNVLLFRGGDGTFALPGWAGPLNRVLVPCQTGLLAFAVGLTMAPARAGRYKTEIGLIGTIKFAVMPTVTGLLALALWNAGFLSESALRVAIVLSAMPVAFNALIPPSLYHLDEDLANSCWIATTCCLAVIVPVLYFLVGPGAEGILFANGYIE